MMKTKAFFFFLSLLFLVGSGCTAVSTGQSGNTVPALETSSSTEPSASTIPVAAYGQPFELTGRADTVLLGNEFFVHLQDIDTSDCAPGACKTKVTITVKTKNGGEEETETFGEDAKKTIFLHEFTREEVSVGMTLDDSSVSFVVDGTTVIETQPDEGE